jgi:hypothetical protein
MVALNHCSPHALTTSRKRPTRCCTSLRRGGRAPPYDVVTAFEDVFDRLGGRNLHLAARMAGHRTHYGRHSTTCLLHLLSEWLRADLVTLALSKEIRRRAAVANKRVWVSAPLQAPRELLRVSEPGTNCTKSEQE